MRRSYVLLTIALMALTVALFSMPSLADAPQYSPLEIAVDNSSNVYVIMGSDSAAGAGVLVLSPDGKMINAYKVDEYADLAIGSDDSLYMSNYRKNYVERIEKNGSPGIFWREDSPGRFIGYIALDRDGALYVSDFNNSDQPEFSVSGRILKISPDRAVTGVIESSPGMPMDKQFKIAVSANGTVYMTDMSGFVLAIYPDGGRSKITPAGMSNSPAARLADVAAGDDGYLYVAEATGGYVYKLATDGAVVTGWGGCGPGRFLTPFSVATDAKGRVYVSDMQGQRVVWFDGSRYRFGNDTAENVAGKGVLWDSVIAAGDIPQPLPVSETLPRQSIPGYNAAIALTGLCLTGVFLYLRRVRRN